MITLVVVDDYASTIKGLEALAKENPNYRLVGCAANGAGAIRLCTQFNPDILLLDLGLPDISGIQVLKQLRNLALTTRTIILSGSDSASMKNDCLSLGALGYVWKASSLALIDQAIRAAMAGEIFVDPIFSVGFSDRKKENSLSGSDAPNLTKRELEILQLLCNGLKTNQIATNLSITSDTVYTHLKSIYSKLGVTNRIDAIKQARQFGLTD